MILVNFIKYFHFEVEGVVYLYLLVHNKTKTKKHYLLLQKDNYPLDAINFRYKGEKQHKYDADKIICSIIQMNNNNTFPKGTE